MATGDYDRLEGARIGRDGLVRSHSIVYSGALIGDRVRTGHHVLVREGSRIGDDVLLGTGTILEDDVHVGSGSKIQASVYLPTHCRIGQRVFIGPRVCVTNDRRMARGRTTLEGVVVEDDARIGANATLLPGIRIGRDSVIGAGSVVTRDVDPGQVVLGVPARVRGEVPATDRAA